eukprot:909550_1
MLMAQHDLLSTTSNPNEADLNTKNKYKHLYVQLKCSLRPPGHSITIKLPFDDWRSNLNFIIQTIRSEFEFLSHMKDSEWLLIANDIIIDKNNAVQFGEVLSAQIPPLAILEIAFLVTSNISLDALVKKQNNITPSNTRNHSDFKISWSHLLACIQHEMWPKLASVIESMLKPIDNYDLSDKCRRNILDILAEKKRLPFEECQYLKELMLRAIEFHPKKSGNPSNPNTDNANLNRNDSHSADGLNLSLLMDIYDVHSIFVFSNFNFSEYTIDQFKANVTDAFGPEFVEKYETNLSFKPRFNPYPVYIIDDDMSRVFDYHFGISWFVNTLKHNLFIEKNTYFEVQCIVIPQSVSCVYDQGMTFNDNLGAMEMYLVHKKVIDFYKIRFKSDTIKTPMDITTQVERHCNIEDIMANDTSKLMIVIDRRAAHRTKHDAMYIFPCQHIDRFSELETNYFLCIQFKMVRSIDDERCSNKVITHFRYGLNGITRFFPEMLVSLMPRFFRKPTHLAPSEYLRQIYRNAFKNGWCVTLDDSVFDKYYHMITAFTHVSVNYNRHILYDEFHPTKPMLCFMDILHHELESNDDFNNRDIDEMDAFIDTNGYCTDSIVDDIWIRPDEQVHGDASNIELCMLSKDKRKEFEIVRAIVHKYNGSPQENKIQICTCDHVLNVDQCSFIRTIIDGLKVFNESNSKMDGINLNISNLLGAYDHAVSVHGFCAPLPELPQADGKLSVAFEHMDHALNISDGQRYIVKQIGGYCQCEACPILQKHIMRRRETHEDEQKKAHKSDHESGLDEILHAALNALHCYLLHEKKELFRLQRENGNSHFVTSLIGDKELSDHMEEHKQEEEEDDTSSNAMQVLHFGVSVLQWLDYLETPTFDGFRNEITQHQESTIDPKTFLIYAQECYIQMNHRKYEQYLLDELLALKIYTDTNVFQSALRRAYWESSAKQTKKSFYNWALLLYKTALFHSKPIPRAY